MKAGPLGPASSVSVFPRSSGTGDPWETQIRPGLRARVLLPSCWEPKDCVRRRGEMTAPMAIAIGCCRLHSLPFLPRNPYCQSVLDCAASLLLPPMTSTFARLLIVLGLVAAAGIALSAAPRLKPFNYILYPVHTYMYLYAEFLSGSCYYLIIIITILRYPRYEFVHRCCLLL